MCKSSLFILPYSSVFDCGQSGDEALQQGGGGGTSVQLSQSAVSGLPERTVPVPGGSRRHHRTDAHNAPANRQLALTWLSAVLCVDDLLARASVFQLAVTPLAGTRNKK